MGASEKMLTRKTATTMKMLLCFNITITLAIASIEEESKPQMFEGDIHHIACVQRSRLEETCKVGPWLECPPDSHKDRTRAWTDPSPNTVPPAPVTSQDLHASKTNASVYLTPSKTVPPAPVTTQDSDPHATPSPARGRDLYDASMNGEMERVKRILDAGQVDINSRGRYSWTPVMAAAWKGHRDVVKVLVGRGADVSLVDGVGNKFLHLACMGGDLETVKLILSQNVVDVNARNSNGETAADYAKLWGRQRLLDLLVSRGAR